MANILYVSHRFLKDSMGGTERLTHDLIHSVIEKNKEHKIYWLSVSPVPFSEKPYRISYGDVVEISVSPSFPQEYPMGWLRAEKAMSASIQAALEELKIQFDVVHIMHFARVGIDFIDIDALNDAKVYVTLTDYTAICPDFHLFKRHSLEICSSAAQPKDCLVCIGSKGGIQDVVSWKERNLCFLKERVNGIFFQTPYQSKIFSALGVPTEKIIREIAFYKLPPVWPTRSVARGGKFRFGYLGRLSIEKGIEVILSAGQDSKENEFHFYALRGDDYDRYSSIIQTIDNFFLHEAVSFNDIGKALSEIDCLLVPSVCLENHPTVLSYALNQGIPILCSDLPSLRHLETISEEIFFVPVGDVLSWKEAFKDYPTIIQSKRYSRSSEELSHDFDRCIELLDSLYSEAKRNWEKKCR